MRSDARKRAETPTAGREWKLGEVLIYNGLRGIVTPEAYDNDAYWAEFADGTLRLLDEIGDKSRPLVVIDPDDSMAVERLQDLYVSAERRGLSGLSMAAALNEFANPTPPKPEEPTGKYAEVEDAEGVVWFRDRNGIWRRPDFTGTDWDNIAAVRVLSEGVVA